MLPLVVGAYLVAYIDRTNIAVAALTMNKDLGFSAYFYGIGAGIFFIGYLLFEVPSNMVLEKVGARIWIARIMITWGIVSGLMATVSGPVSFLSLRFLLGVAEAGFLPGMIFYFTYWFPARYRGRVISTLTGLSVFADRWHSAASYYRYNTHLVPSLHRRPIKESLQHEFAPNIQQRDRASLNMRAGRVVACS